ncbi:hypothetical protein LZP73_04815 [Shewanella sp. AS16]|uniref:hypothetical protein n=1 Tax=Shewanella sp. AS16 TaxID=2907625 RepID=UPI001F27EA13|nr:hypothetical protein [Shewanella sp. AS16]MCE9685540.1 hypothetical protein [Shewanella sp. AS16]
MSPKTVQAILAFFDDIGLPYKLGDIHEASFLPGIRIVAGGLLIDMAKLLYPGDLLHEAGHIAVSPETARGDLCGDMKDAGHQGGEEMAAIAWSWAAAMHLGLAPEVLFHPHGYRGASTNLIEAFAGNRGFGYPLLYSWFMCEQPGHPQGFPKMLRWFRDEAYRRAQLGKL